MAPTYAPGALHIPTYQGHRPAHSAVEGVAPPGMENVVQKLKRSGNVSNPWALAWWMKKHGRTRGVAAQTTMDDVEAAMDDLIAESARHGIPSVFVEAANGSSWAQAWCLQEGEPMLYQEQR